MAHVTRGKVWAARVWDRLRYVLNPREIELGGRAPAVQIHPGAFEPLRKCFGEPGTLEQTPCRGFPSWDMNRERELGLDRRETG